MNLDQHLPRLPAGCVTIILVPAQEIFLRQIGNERVNISVVIPNLVQKFFCGRMRGTVVTLAGILLKVVIYVDSERCLAGLFVELCGFSDII